MLQIFYYWLYKLILNIKTNDQPFSNAYLGISFFLCLNVMTVFAILNFYFSFSYSKNEVVYSGIFMYLFITTLNFFLLFKKRKEIVSRLNVASLKNKRNGKI